MRRAMENIGGGVLGPGAGDYCRRLGLRAVFADSGTAELELPPLATLCNTLGTVHGGVLASAVIAAAELAAWSSQRSSTGSRVLDEPLVGRPSDFSIQYLVPARAETLRVKAEVLARGRRLVHVAGRVIDSADRVVAASHVAYRLAPEGPTAVETAGAAPNDAETLVADAGEAIRRRSPYVRAMGARLVRSDERAATLEVPLDGNEGRAGYVHAGAIAGAADTAAAIAARAHLSVEVPSKMGTTSMALSFLAAGSGPLRVTASVVGRDGEAFSARVEASTVDSVRIAAYGAVSFRFEE